MHTSHPQAGWENRCQQSTTHSAGKEPDRTSNEQQAAHQPFATARFTWYLQYNVLHIAVCGPQRRAGFQAQPPGVRYSSFLLRGSSTVRHNGELHNWKGIQLAFMCNAQLQNISPMVCTVLFFLSKLLFSAVKSVCKQYYFDSSGNIWESRKRFP